MRETTIAENYEYGQAAIWGSDAHRASVEVRKIEREESDAELWADGPARHDMIAKVRAFDDGSVEFSGYRRTVVQRLGDLRNLPRRARGAKPETEDDKDARAASVKSAAKRAKQNVRLRCKTARVTHMVTLTTRECITDLERFLKLWDAFRRIMARHREFHYIAVPEPQKRGAWHMHVAVSGRAALNLARRAWLKVVGGRGKGYCHIRNPQGAHFGKQWKLDALAVARAIAISVTRRALTSASNGSWMRLRAISRSTSAKTSLRRVSTKRSITPAVASTCLRLWSMRWKLAVRTVLKR